MSGTNKENKRVTQDEIINNTKNVVRGLETLKNEHSGILKNLSPDFQNGEVNVKTDILQTSLEKIELGIGEAQVKLLDRYWWHAWLRFNFEIRPKEAIEIAE